MVRVIRVHSRPKKSRARPGVTVRIHLVAARIRKAPTTTKIRPKAENHH